MKRLPPIKTKPFPDEQKMWLTRWFGLWHAEQQVRPIATTSSPHAETCRAGQPFQVKAYDQAPMQPGEIRLLAPGVTPEADEPVFVAVISEWKPVGFLVTPFSRFPVPGLTGEVFTGWKEPQLRVLNVWNSYSLSPEALRESWLIDQLSPEECRVARAVFRHAIFGHDLEPALQNRIGPPIVHPDDPRLIYQQQELQRLAGLARIQQREGDADTPADVLEFIAEAEAICNAEHTELLMAAADTLSNRAVVMDRSGSSGISKLTYTARADGDFVIAAGQTTAPATMWELEDIADQDAEKLADATVLFIDTASKKVVAEGAVDESGSIITASVIHPDALEGQPFDAGNLMLLIILE